jgi:hypothetical protein
LIGKYNWMCDLHLWHMEIDNLTICFCILCVYVCCWCKYNTTVKSWIAPGWSQQTCKMPMGASNRRHTSNMLCLLLVPQWHHPVIKSVMGYVKACLEFLCNGRRVTLSASPISATISLAGNQISDSHLYSVSQINF